MHNLLRRHSLSDRDSGVSPALASIVVWYQRMNNSRLCQTRHPTPSVTPRAEASNPFSRLPPVANPGGAAESLLDALASKLKPITPGASGGATPSTPTNGARNYQTTHHGSNAGQPRVQRRTSRSSARRNSSRSLSSSRHDPSSHSIKWHFESNPHVSIRPTRPQCRDVGAYILRSVTAV